MNKLFTIILSLFSLPLAAQTSQLEIHLYSGGDTEFSLYLLKETDTAYSTDIPLYYDDFIELDSLEAGTYRLYVYDLLNQKEHIASRTFILEEGKMTNIQLNLNFSEYIEESEPNSIKQKAEIQFGVGYFNGQWEDPASLLKKNFSINYSANGWTAFTKHFGLLYGGGIGISQHYFDKDTTLFPEIQHTKKTERYASVFINYELKVRFSTGNQQLVKGSDNMSSSKFFIDLGAGYYLPLLFNHTAVYKGSKKFIDRNIHNFNDFRTFVNIGFAPVSIYAEYRLSDFVRGNNPQLPKLHTGIRLLIPIE